MRWGWTVARVQDEHHYKGRRGERSSDEEVTFTCIYSDSARTQEVGKRSCTRVKASEPNQQEWQEEPRAGEKVGPGSKDPKENQV